MKGLEFESLACRIIYLIARGGNELVTTVSSLAGYLDASSNMVRKELAGMVRDKLIGIEAVNMEYRVRDINFSGNYIRLFITPKADSLIRIGDSNLYYMNKAGR